ncbi:DUF3455 domain-containing protein [Paraburkholderia sp.]|uniref:DUF3455 domain-containing protein n=1 Tax=Paraburkholderia sp. TaxID=1926495 RepID=UPI003D6E6CBD
MSTRCVLRSGFAGVVGIAVVSMLSACAVAPGGTAPAVSIDPPAPTTRVLSTHASGVQIYSCEYDAQHRLGWVFRSPQATLYDASGHAAIHHFAGPSWEAEDGSRIVGHVLAQRPGGTKASVPELLLETHLVSGSGLLSDVRYVQRVNTVGGLAPQAACTTEHQAGSTPYLAEYVFYR